MKRFIPIVLTLTLSVYSCLAGYAQENENKYRELSDPNLRTYLEDTLYDELLSELDSDEYYVENVQAIYISQEYLDELAYNSAANVFFGYSLDELAEQFQGEKYIFTLAENGETTVKAWEPYDDLYEKIIRNVVVGTGAIVICVAVSSIAAGAGSPVIYMIFTVAADTAKTSAISGAVLGGISAGIIKGRESGDFNEVLRAAALAGSEGFKVGAVTGSVLGGVGEAIGLSRATLHGLTIREAAKIQKESKYPLKVIRQFKSFKEYEVYRTAQLKALRLPGLNNDIALLRKIDLNYVKPGQKWSNLERMKKGLSPFDPSGLKYELHHINQAKDGTLAILTSAEHQANAGILNSVGKASEIDRTAFTPIRQTFWKAFADNYNVLLPNL